MAKMNWHRGKDEEQRAGSQAWRTELKGPWRGSKPIQRPVKGVPFTTVLQVPSTRGSMLLKEIARIEPKLTKMTGYAVKLVEKNGVPLARMFNRKMENRHAGELNAIPAQSPPQRSPNARSVMWSIGPYVLTA